MASISNDCSYFPSASCDIASLKCTNKQIIIYKGQQEICSGQGCKSSVNGIAQQLYDTVLSIRNFFWLRFGICGIDGQGEIPPLQIGWEQNDAQWICSSSLAHSCYFRFHDQYAVQPKIVAHEYMHGIITRLRPINYQNESGALNESLADVFGIAFNFARLGDTSWKIVDRDISVPVNVAHNLTPYARDPSHLNDYGGVHTNSRIPSHAFYIAVQLINEPRDSRIAQIWFLAFLDAEPNETFLGFACKTITQAQKCCDNNFAFTVQEAWISVGVLRQYIPLPMREQRNNHRQLT